MLILKEEVRINSPKLKENSLDMVYTVLNRKGVWDKIIQWKKENQKIITYMSFDIIDYTIIGGLFNKIKVEGTQVKFIDTRTPFNFYWLSAKDIVLAKLAENAETKYEALWLTMRGKYSVHIRPE